MIQMVRRILRFSGPYAKRIRTAYLFSFLKSIFSNAPLFLSAFILNRLSEGSMTIGLCIVSAAALFAFFLLAALFQHLSDAWQSTAGYELFAEKRIEFARHLRKLPMGYFTTGNLGRISSILSSDMVFIEENSMNVVADVGSDLFAQFILTIFLFSLHPCLGLCALGCELLVFLIAQSMDREAAANSNRRQASIEALTDSVIEYIEGLSVSRSFCLTGRSAGRLRAGFRRMTESNLAFEAEHTPYERKFQLVYGLGMTAVLAMAIHLLETGRIPAGSFLSVILMLFSLFSPLRHMYQMYTRITIMRSCLDRLEEVLSQPVINDSGAAVLKETFDHEIEFQNVCFSYDGREVLHNITFSLNPGETAALVGESGSGKTTIASLLTRFWDIQSGSIRFRGTDIRELPLSVLTANISAVFQNVYLFEDTVYNNIAMGKPDASRQEVEDAAKKAQCYDFIMKMPYGFDTVLSEGGASLSGGERQRISIARCILKDAPVIILDEATASVDTQNEAKIHKAMTELCRNKTVLVIAHRLNTVRSAEQILVIHSGELAEHGTHEELVRKNGLYRKMLELQDSAGSEEVHA